MEKIWKRIEAWLEENAPDVLADLRPGASDADIKKAERSLSCDLPADMADSYRIHDGKRGAVGKLFGKWELMQLAHVVKSWKTLKKVADDGTFEKAAEAFMGTSVAPQIKPDWWNPKWIPVASNSSGDFLCVDLDPARGGKSGQVISYLHTDPKRELVAKDFKSWLSGFAKDLEAGKYEAHGEDLTKKE